MRTKISPSCDRPPRGRVAVTVAAAATMRKVMASPASPFAISEASGIGIPKAAAPLPVGWRGTAGEVQGNAGGNSDQTTSSYMLRKNLIQKIINSTWRLLIW